MKKLGFFVFASMLVTLNLFILSKFSNSNLAISWRVASQICSLFGLILLSISFLLSSRWRFLDKWFGGFDQVYKYHHMTGAWSFLLLLHHPLFLAIDALPRANLSLNYLWFSGNLSDNFGLLALYGMALLLILTLLINLPYSVWKKTHEYMGVTLIFASLHVFTVMSDVTFFWPLKIWVWSNIFLAGIAIVYRRFLYEFIGPKYEYVVESVERKGEVIDLVFRPGKKIMPYSAGQFVFVSFPGISKEKHPFSIASASDKEQIRLGIKILGDYTLKLIDIKVGEKVIFWGPYGQFWQGARNDKNLVCIAGGIGITPFLGIVEEERKSQKRRQLDLIYCTRDATDAVYDKDLEQNSRGIETINYTRFFSNLEGRITAGKVAEKIGELSGRKILICGPEAMMLSLADQFKKMGVKNRDIYYENFNFK